MLDRLFPEKKFAAFLFDFDGTVADTMPAHLQAWNKALKIYDLSMSKEQHMEWAGRPTVDIVRLLNERHGTSIDPQAFTKQKEIDYFASIASVREIGSVMDIIRASHGTIPMAIVSGSRHRPVETTLNQLGIAHYFDVLVCAEDYTRGKPEPDCFLQAASLLKVPPSECLVFEDANLGIEAAHRAGMACVRVTETHDLQRSSSSRS